MEYRKERDSIGEKYVEKDAYYGVQSLRGYENFRISGLNINKEFIKNLAIVKKACAITNEKTGELKRELSNAIIKACDEIYDGKYFEQFIIDPIQGGAGTSMNMNINEIIANRANEILGYEKGEYYPVHPNDHVNMGQSTNDVIPTAASITAYKLLVKCIKNIKVLESALNEKAKEFTDIIKMGRTEMQDAVPISLGSEFKAFSLAIGRDANRLENVKDSLLTVNLGGTAVGTGITATKGYIKEVTKVLKELFGEDINQSEDLIDGTQNLDKYADISSQLKVCAVNLSKISGDLILMSSGPRTGFGEIKLPSKQNGSSIMPGKVNPVMPEVMKQIAFQIMGNDLTITMATQSGQLELNAFYPIIMHNIYESIIILTNGIETFVENCIKGIEANEIRCNDLVNGSIGIVTALAPVLGYEKAAYIAKKALNTERYVKDVAIEECGMQENEVSKILNIKDMINLVS
ncbi:aspartate ammonia-lyase [Clostridium tertium]|jgi:aspartate ammonia-lyase|uniref:Aspartate ammonia-lyase n=1 Tax=Clostridium tertium TaxID=1559 RepID=A0A9X3XK78_9CLOT|nr:MULTISPECIES: aspartate ammonia-lyase [Clostridium]EEH96517.1 aspartate ammonia-lyase [Clostridium sp. 7_2_43FAA]MBU6134039.1 aspartate ammonia-lyase [Clostridium tertium]MDB1939899.1 aspartate ammonia-lyase [Clostridium tertium]MDB1946336.1 aspartate ammonia-lyase [Clostridium tertium]MDB1955146.1 aspartate ammonia-lyase [Clostridium tertium]